MPGNFKKEDFRVEKTIDALMESMSNLLELQNFNQITVNDLCVGARICKATFYYHFKDKYDLLEKWLTKTKSEITYKNDANKDIAKGINDFVNSNEKEIKHLIEDANSETLDLLCDFMLSLLDIDKMENGEISLKYCVLSRFCCGGIINYLAWQMTNTSKTDSQKMDSYFYNILSTLYKWNADHE